MAKPGKVKSKGFLPPALVQKLALGDVAPPSPAYKSVDGGLNQFSSFSAITPDTFEDEDFRQGQGASVTGSASTPLANLSSIARKRFLRVLNELMKRQMESLVIYSPLANQLAFHQSRAIDRLLIGSNRSGKSQASGAEVAWIMMGCHPWRKMPKENCRLYAVGWDWDHVGKVMWPKVGMEDSFKIIRDEHTQKWRPVIPDQPYDAAYSEKWRAAPPFIPPRWIKSISWESRKDNQPKCVKMVNGSELFFFSSKGAPQQGNEIDAWWCDEELENPRWVSELQRGCVKRRGGGFYSATPLAASEALFEMHRRAMDPGKKWPVEEYNLLISENIYIGKKEKDIFYQQLLTPAEIRTRWFGQFAISGLVVYPEFSPEEHVIDPFDPPPYWNRYMVVDPGAQVCAVLFCAVPPPYHPLLPGREPYKWANTVHIYDELYIERCNAQIFAEQVAKKLGDWKRGGFEAFIIDHSMGRQTEVGSGRTVEIQYGDELAKQGVYSHQTGSGFFWGTTDIHSREESLRRWLIHRPDTGKPTLRIHRCCKKLIWEMPNQFFKKDAKTGMPTEKRRDVNDHAVSCLEYFADADPAWTSPAKPVEPDSWAVASLKAKRRKQRAGGGGHVNLGPMGGS